MAANFTATCVFRGQTLSISQAPRDKGVSGEDNTGWLVWECANVMLRLLDTKPDVACIASAPDGTSSPLKGVKLCDVSAGTGLIAIGAAIAGAHAVATDIEEQMVLLQQNISESLPIVESSGCGGSVSAHKLYWGDDVAILCPSGELFDVSVISDVLFIAIRDGLCDKLAMTLVNLAEHSRCVLFGFEERLISAEQEFMDSLPEVSGNTLIVEEIPGIEAKKDERLLGVGSSTGEVFIADDMFWEPPPLRVFRITLK